MAWRWPWGYPLVSQEAFFFFQNASKFTRILPHDLKQSFSFCILCSLEIAETYLKNHQQMNAFLGAFRNWILFRVTQLIAKRETSSFARSGPQKRSGSIPWCPHGAMALLRAAAWGGRERCSPRPGLGAPWGGGGASLPPDGVEGWGRFSFGSPLRAGPLLLPVAAAGAPRSPATEPPGGIGEPGLRPGRAGASTPCSPQCLQAGTPADLSILQGLNTSIFNTPEGNIRCGERRSAGKERWRARGAEGRESQQGWAPWCFAGSGMVLSPELAASWFN